METLILKRPYERFNKFCSYTIFLNGRKIGELKNGEEKYIEIESLLDKEIEIMMGWCGSGKRKIRDNNLIITGNIFLNRTMPALGGLFPLIGLLIIRNQEGMSKNIGIGIFILFFVSLLSTITLFRKRWIRIRELNTT